MYLKEIELLGFKSFPVKTKIGFEPGISCVVGPNGSGKSNIADALRWVLGEQSSKALRGGKLEDVIFSGSKNRRRLGMAEVTLTLDNSDGYLNQPFSEVSVTRRAFRAGASEYQINSSNCRLRDIQDLFVDTGVGIDGISVVTQGRISEMINARPEDRRSLVEEAAGIVKYRNRKREAVRKLDETERHLERVGDIIGELENRLGPLKRQAEVAEKYLRLKDEADKSEIAISVKVLSEAQERIDQYQKQINTNQEELLKLESLRSALYTEQEQLKLAIAGMDEEVAQLQHSYYQLQTDREKAESRLQLAEAQKATSAANLQRLQAELQALLTGAELRRTQAADLSKALAEAETAAKELEERILTGEGGEKSRREAVEMLTNKLEEAKNEAFSIAAELAELRNRSHYQQQLQEKNLQSGFRVELAWQDAQKQIDEYNQQAEANSARRAELRAALDAATALAAANSAAMMELNKQLAELSAAATEARYDCHSLRVKAGMMEDLLANYDGFFPGVRGILAARGKDKAAAGVIDVAANLLDVPEKYQRAVEAFLGASLQNVVTETEADAISAVRYLKQRDLGRATFLPLDTLRVREAADFSAVLGKPGVCGRASELVSCDKKLDPIREFLLNSLLVVEDLDTAAAMAAKLKYRHHVVTLDGDMVNQGGSISGGSKPKKNNELLSRRSQLAEAKAKLEAAEEKAKQLEAQLDALRAQIDEKAAEADRIEAENRGRQSELHQLEAAANQAQAALAAIVRQAKATEAEREQIADERVQIEEALIDISKSTEVWAARDEQVREEMATLSAQLEESRSGLDESREDMTRQRVELAALKQKNSGDRAAIKKLAEEIEAAEWDAEAKAADITAEEAEAARIAAEIEQAQLELLELGKTLLEQKELLEGKRHGQAAEAGRLAELEKQGRETGHAIIQLNESIHKTELLKTRWVADWENEEAKLADKFTMTFAEAKLLELPQAARRDMESRLRDLRRQIDALGNVNVGAIEEYAEVSERFSFLTTQRDDLLAAKEQLGTVIKEMDGIMTGRFKDAFEALSAAFNESFRRLFGGGSAALVLSDPQNILETGVDLAVTLPGKKVSNYNLLSGGEKSLIGMALMFAMLAVRTMPFCIMDEVDAALDEANIDRFCAYLQELSDKTQFIMITHRQSTMEAASALWGVTMEEEGVSKIVSMRLNDAVNAN